MSLRENPHFQEAEEHKLEPMIRLPLVDALRRISSKQGTVNFLVYVQLDCHYMTSRKYRFSDIQGFGLN